MLCGREVHSFLAEGECSRRARARSSGGVKRRRAQACARARGSRELTYLPGYLVCDGARDGRQLERTAQVLCVLRSASKAASNLLLAICEFVTFRRRLNAHARATNRARAGSTITAAVETGAIRFAIVWHPRGVPLEIYAASESGAGRAKFELQPSSKKRSN